MKLTITSKFIILLLLSTLLFACASTPLFESSDVVQSFLKVYPDADYDIVFYSVDEANAMKDLFVSECDIEAPFERVVYQEYGAKLILYTKDDKIVCALTKLDTDYEIIQGVEGAEGVALTVNDQPITLEELNTALSQLPEDQKDINSINLVIDKLVGDLLLNEAAKDYVVSDDEVQERFTQLLSEASVSEDQLTANKDLVLESIKNQIKQEKLLNDKLDLKSIEVDDDEAEDYYLANTNSFVVSEQVSFNHLFLSSQERTEDELIADANFILSSEDDFCSLVLKYSDDVDSRERCGLYTIPKGVVDPQLEQAAFNTPVGQVTAVKLVDGLHIIKIQTQQPSQVVPYASVKDQVKGLVVNNIAQLRLNAYLASLKADAEIINYLQVQ